MNKDKLTKIIFYGLKYFKKTMDTIALGLGYAIIIYGYLLIIVV